MDFETIENNVFRLMRDPNKDKYSSTFVQSWINYAEQLFCTKVEIHFKVDTSITTDGSNEYDLPTDYESEITVWYNDDEYELKEKDPEEVVDYTGSPYYYYIKNDTTLVIPGSVPSGKTIRLIYYSIGGSMSDSADTPQIPTKYHMALVFLACYLCSIEGDDMRGEEFWNGFLNLVNLAGVKNTEGRFGNEWPVIGEDAQETVLFQEPDIDRLW